MGAGMRRFIMIAGVLGLFGCKQEAAAPSKPAPAEAKPAPAAAVPGMPGPSSAGLSADAQAGHRLYAVCHSCHDPNLEPPQGPPMFGVQRRYKRATGGKQAFVDRMVTFVETPTKETAVMTPAVERLGLMPPLPLGKEPLRQLATYIFEAEFAPPCAHWKFALERDAKAAAEAGEPDQHMRQDRKMYDKFCK